jgi:hypothetical protein
MLRNISYCTHRTSQRSTWFQFIHSSSSYRRLIFIVKYYVIILPSTTTSSKRLLLLSKSHCLIMNYKRQVLKRTLSIVTFEARVLKVPPLIVLNLLHVPPIFPFPLCNHCKYVRLGIQFMNLTI